MCRATERWVVYYFLALYLIVFLLFRFRPVVVSFFVSLPIGIS